MNRRELFGAGLVAGLAAGLPRAGADHGTKAAGGRPDFAPLAPFHLHVCGIHLGKSDPKAQFVVQHYCGPCGKQLHQCLLFDGTSPEARLIGVEYIVPDDVYRGLPDGEKKYWHPHTYEMLAGGLIVPGLSRADETKLLAGLLTTWGKTWHTWPDPATAVPLGEPMLMWAATGDGQIDEKVLAARDRAFGVKCDQLREVRGQAIGYEVPQVPAPRSADEVGRQWMANGDDKPTKRR